MPIELSIVVPVYQCVECLAELHRRIQQTLTGRGLRYEFIFVDDRSPDESWEFIRKLAGCDGSVRGMRLDRNYGQIPAIAAGVSRSRGEWVLVIDCDLQDPPELIPYLLDARRRAPVVVCRFDRRAHAVWRLFASNLYFFFLRLITGNPFAGRAANFCLAHREVVNRYLDDPRMGAVYMIALTALTDEVAIVNYHKAPRSAGSSAYTPGKLARMAIVHLSAYPDRSLYIVWAPAILLTGAFAGISAMAGSMAGLGLAAVTAGLLAWLYLATFHVRGQRLSEPFRIAEETNTGTTARQ